MRINGIQHAWASIQSIDAGFGDMPGVQEISYESKQDNKLRFGRGVEPRGMSLGNVDYSGQIVMDRDEFYDSFLPWVLSTGAASIQELPPFSLEISRQRHAEDYLVTTRLTGVKLGGEQSSISQGATEDNITIPFIFLEKIEAF